MGACIGTGGSQIRGFDSEGGGPPRQSEPIDFEAALLLTFTWAPLVQHGPTNTLAGLVLFTFFLIRELEGSLARRAHMWTNREEKRVYWILPASKTDAQALGCTREWATCDGGAVGRRPRGELG